MSLLPATIITMSIGLEKGFFDSFQALGYNPNMRRKNIVFLTAIISLGACTPTTLEPMPTLASLPTSSPTPFLQSSESIEMPSPSVDPFQSAVTPSIETLDVFSTETPTQKVEISSTVTPTTTPVPQPLTNSGEIQLLGPGPLSKVISPISVYGYTLASISQLGRVDLYGEDGRLLASKQLFLESEYKWAFFKIELSFKSIPFAELGRISVSTLDEYGRENAVTSYHLFLLSEGGDFIYPSGSLKERCVLQSPNINQSISGGSISIIGKFLPYNHLPLNIRLINRDRSIITSQTIPMIYNEGDGYVPFQLLLRYSISSARWAMLEIKQDDDRIPGTAYLFSQEIFLNP
jgi:hypothetical protein